LAAIGSCWPSTLYHALVAWYCTAIGVLVWYIPDTAMSLRFGVAINVVINSILLVGVALPLIFTRKAFREVAK
jgi:hypothetical protein